ncbi:HD domain-containing phosphohydrolase [Ideonella sp. DXS29W]|uniref:HD domain-containing phosphohydrolase n=1 Tax=Ideonella lacteola TaxID=2984193 RepID=A0ABU9BL62_9BURK
MTSTVEPQDLRIGMFIHLDGGWMSHPFPLSSFKISSEEQIQTIRSLGLKKLRWSPERSDLPTEPATTAKAGDEAPVPEAPPQEPIVVISSAPEDPAARARRLAAARAEAEAASLRVCERQYQEACRDLRRVNDAIGGEPERARAGAQALARALLDKMLIDAELCVRVLGEPVGDRHSAHAINVTVVSLLLARALKLSESDMADLGTGALLHDMGKIELPDRVRLPHDDFTSAEASLYRDHVGFGITQGRRMGLAPGALLVVAQHHELADGSGFPKGVTAERMSVGSRIVSLVNYYDNLCNAATPSKSLTPHEALSRMFAQSRNKFDATILSGFIHMMGIYPPGSLVQLSDDRYAMVTSVNSARPLKPHVRVCDPTRDGRALHLNLEECPDLGIRRSLRASQLPARAAEVLAPRQRVAYFFDVSATPTVEEQL